MDDVLHADATDDDTVRAAVAGVDTELDVEIAEQLHRDLGRALDKIGTDEQAEFKQKLRSVNRIGPTLVERFADEFDGMDELVEAPAFEILEVEGVGQGSAGEIQRDVQRRYGDG